MIAALGVAAALVGAVVLRPRTALWIALVFPLVQAFYSPPLLRLLVLVLLILCVPLGWKTMTHRQRNLIGHLWLGVILTLIIGWVLASDPSQAQGAVVNILYATAAASLVVVYRMTAFEWCVCIMGWGAFVSLWLTKHDIVLTGRTGGLYIGENANALGMFAALGFVGAFVLALGRPFHALRFLGFAAIGIFCFMGVLSSASRGALVVAMSGAVVHLCGPMLQRSGLRAMVALSVIGMASFWALPPIMTWFLRQSGRNIDITTNFDAREGILSEGVQTGVEHFLAGTGFASLDVAGVFGAVSAHNAYVGLFAATGIIPATLLAILTIAAINRARVSHDQNLLPLLVAGVAVGLSLDWVPTAKLGTVVLALLVSGAARTRDSREAGNGDVSAVSSRPNSIPGARLKARP